MHITRLSENKDLRPQHRPDDDICTKWAELLASLWKWRSGESVATPNGNFQPLPSVLGNPRTTRVPTFPQRRRLRAPLSE